jgi:hypothetical protein
MARWVRTSAALVAAYAFALQALLTGFVAAAHFGLDPLAVICTADGSGEHAPSIPQGGNGCDACLAACAGSPGVVPSSLAAAPISFVAGAQPLAASGAAVSPHASHRPQAPRAPPILLPT